MPIKLSSTQQERVEKLRKPSGRNLREWTLELQPLSATGAVRGLKDAFIYQNHRKAERQEGGVDCIRSPGHGRR